MRFLADVNIPQSVINHLIKIGHDVLDIKKQNLELKDTEIIKIARDQKRIILTRDKDFIALTQFPKYRAATLAIRLRNQNPGQIIDYLTQLLKNQEADILKSSLTIVTEESANSYPFNRD